MNCLSPSLGSPDTGRSLETFHDFVDRQKQPQLRGAAERLAADVEAAIGEIGRRSEAILAIVNAQALGAGVRIKDQTAACIDNIRNETTTTAGRLLRNIRPGTDEKSAARAAGRILENASKLSAELQEKAEAAAASIIREMEATSHDVRQIRDEAVRGLAELAEDAMLKLAETEERTRAAEGAWETAPTVEDALKSITAEAIKALAEATEKVARAACDAAARLNDATDRAIAAVRQTADAAMQTIGRVIDDANARILGVTEEAVTAAVPREDIDHFNLAALKEKWRPRNPR